MVTFRPAEGVVFNRVGDELVLLDLHRGIYYGLDPVGARIWQLLSEGAGEGEIVARLGEEYDVERETLAADLGRLIAELRGCGLLLD
ncbi:MAG TPA: PqqD family protein [Thermoanaerobaculia bacterium]|nr:PqqD family protein [Thermoanaerobaculia bacterium]